MYTDDVHSYRSFLSCLHWQCLNLNIIYNDNAILKKTFTNIGIKIAHDDMMTL